MATSLPDDTDWQACQDAECLQKHGEITSDPNRHKAAMGKLQDKHDAVKTALANSMKKMRGRVKKGLSKAFPKDAAGTADKTPFEEAEKGDA